MLCAVFLVAWLIIKGCGGLTAICNTSPEPKEGFIRYFVFGFVPPVLIAPWTSVVVHSDCPQIATINFKLVWMCAQQPQRPPIASSATTLSAPLTDAPPRYIGLGVADLVVAPCARAR